MKKNRRSCLFFIEKGNFKKKKLDMKIYHNPRCKKSRAGLEYLKTKTSDLEVIDYLKNLLSEADLSTLLMKLNKNPEDIVRKQEDQFKKELKNKKFTKEEWIKIMAENPKLIQRPIVEGKYKAVIGDPAENIDILF